MRSSAWFNRAGRPGSLSGRCRPCKALYSKQRSEMLQHDMLSQKPVTEKRCSACEKTLPAADFSKGGVSLDGLHASCRECSKKSGAAWSANRRERSRNQTMVFLAADERICSQCRVCKPRKEFHKCVHADIGISSTCKSCRSTVQAMRKALVSE